VLQVSLRHPIELAHRVQSVHALSGGRLRLGVGSGSTRADFDLLGADYEQRFRTLMRSLEIMRRAWSGEPVNGGVLSPWPGCEGGPRCCSALGRNPALDRLCGKTVRGMGRLRPLQQLGDLQAGMRLYREAGGTNAVLANVLVDLRNKPEPGSLAERAAVSLVCSPDEARVRAEADRAIGLRRGTRRLAGGALDELETRARLSLKAGER